MIHIVTSANRHLYRRQVWAMFEGRRLAFVERCGWADLMVFDGAEVDDCDDERAIYQLALNADEDLLGAVRVRPTEDHGILADKFPELIAEGQPPMKGPDVWEATRVFTTPLYRETRQKGDHLLPLLALAAKEACFYGGAERAVGMVDMQFWAGRSDGPAHVRMTGLPVQYAYGLVGGTVEDCRKRNWSCIASRSPWRAGPAFWWKTKSSPRSARSPPSSRPSTTPRAFGSSRKKTSSAKRN